MISGRFRRPGESRTLLFRDDDCFPPFPTTLTSSASNESFLAAVLSGVSDESSHSPLVCSPKLTFIPAPVCLPAPGFPTSRIRASSQRVEMRKPRAIRMHRATDFPFLSLSFLSNNATAEKRPTAAATPVTTTEPGMEAVISSALSLPLFQCRLVGECPEATVVVSPSSSLLPSCRIDRRRRNLLRRRHKTIHSS